MWTEGAVKKQLQILRLGPTPITAATMSCRWGSAQDEKSRGARIVVKMFLLFLLAATGHAQEKAAQTEVLDRVVAVVNNQSILWSDVRNEIRFAVLDATEENGTLTPQRALQQLISRTLIQQQIRQEDVTAAQPTDAEVQARMNELRKELPACVQTNCATDAGWKNFLNTNGLTAEQIEGYLRLRLQILGFIEIRFRQSIGRISPQETEAYYRDKLVPKYTNGAQAPPLNAVAPRIEEILLEQQVNVMFDNWLDNLRKLGNVEVLDASLEPATQTTTGSDRVE